MMCSNEIVPVGTPPETLHDHYCESLYIHGFLTESENKKVKARIKKHRAAIALATPGKDGTP